MLPRLAASALTVSLSCVRVEPYLCESDAECLSAAGGRCELDGHCSYSDPACEGSLQRYGPLAGALAGRCVDAAGGSSTSTSTSASASTSTTPETTSTDGSTGSDSTAAPDPEHGMVEWFFVHAGDAGYDDTFWGVEAIDDVDFVVAGSERAMKGGRNIVVARYPGNNDPVWFETRDVAGAADLALTMVRGSDGSLYVGGQRDEDGANGGWIGRWDVDGGEQWFAPIDLGWAVQDLAYAQGGLIGFVGITNQSHAYAGAHRSYDQPAWDHEIVADSVALHAIAARGSEIFVGGYLDDQAYIGRADEAGLTELALYSEGPGTVASVQRLATTDDAIFAVGYSSTLDSTQGWLARLDVNGKPVWDELRGSEADNDELESLVVAEDGTLYAVGLAGSPEGYDIWVTAWTPGGELVWTQTYPELDEGNAIARDVAVTPTGDLLVVGEAENAAGDRDAFVARLHP